MGLTGNTILLSGAGAITDSGAIAATALGVQNTAGVTLDHVASDVDSLAANVGANNFSFTDADGFNIATVGTITGIQGNTITLTAGGAVTDSNAIVATALDLTSVGNITLDHAANNLTSLRISASGYDVVYNDLNAIGLQDITADSLRLSAGGAITNSGRLLIGDLGIQAGGTVTLDTANNNVDNLAISAGSNDITFRDEDGFNISTVGPYSGLTGGIMTLTAGGAVSASTAISGTSLALTAAGNATLNNVSNALTNLAVSASGYDVLYRDANALNIAAVGSVSGITAASLDLRVAGNLADTASLNITGHTNIISTSGTITLNEVTNDFNSMSVSHVGNVSIVDANALTITDITRTGGTGTAGISAASGITVTGDISTGALTLDADSDGNGVGTFTLNGGASINSLANAAVTIASGDLVLNGTIASGTGITTVRASGGNTIDLGNGGGGAYNISQAELDRITASIIRVGGTGTGAITVSSNISAANSDTLRLQGAGITATAGAIIETNLAISSTGAVTITNTGNDVETLAVSASGQSVSFYNSDDLIIGAADGLSGSNATTLRLEVAGNVTDSQALTGTGLAVLATGDITLDHTSNNYSNIAFYAPGRTVSYHDANAVVINTVSGVTGVESATFNLSTSNGAITDSARTLVSGTTTFTAGTGGITLDHASNDFNRLAIVSAGAVTAIDANALTLGNVTASGTTTLEANNGLTVDGNITTGGVLTLNADRNADNAGTLTINTARTVSTAAANRAITLAGADLLIQGTGAINSGTATTTMRAAGATRGVNIGGAGAVYNVSQAEINAVTAGALQIQSGTGASTLTVGGNITAPSGTNTLHLQSGSGGISASGYSIKVANLALQASGGGNINATNSGNDVDNLAIQIATGTADFRDADSVNIGTVSGVTGLNTTLSAGAGRTVHIQAAGITDSSPSSVQNFGFTSTGAVVLDQATNNFATVAGNATGQNVTITDTNALAIGQIATLAPSTVTGIRASNLTLNTGGAITGPNQSVISGNLTIDAGTSAVTLDHTLNDFSTVLINAAGNTRLSDVNSVTIGASTLTGTLRVDAYDNISVIDNLTTTGLMAFRADMDGNGVGSFTVNSGRAVSSSNASLYITATDLILNGSLSSGTGETTITTVGGRTIGIGDTAANMSISKSELQRITAGNLYIGGSLAGNIIVDNIAVSDLTGISDSLYILALGNGSDIRFLNHASFFKNIYGEADDSIFVDKNLTATVGQISLRADIDGSPDPDGDQIYVTDGISVTSVGSSLFESTNGITIGQNVNIFGDLVINADTDNDGIGTLNLLNGFSIATNNYDLSMIAGDFILDGLINAGTGNIKIETTNNRTIGVGDAAGDVQISKAELQRLFARTLYIGGIYSGNIAVDNVAVPDLAGVTGAVTLAAVGPGANISFNGNASSFGDDLILLASNGVSLNRDVTADGAITVDADYDNDGAGNFRIAASRTLSSNDHDITIDADDVSLPGMIDSGAAQTILRASDNGAIDLGGAGGGFNLTAGELDNIVASVLRIGSASGGAITISADISPANTDTMVLSSGSTVTATAGGIVIDNLGLSTGGAILITNANTDIGTLAASASSGNITVYHTGLLQIGDVGGLSGLSAGAGNMLLRVGDLNIASAINGGAGTVTFEGANGATIGLGGTGGAMNLSAAELALVSAGTLHIGEAGAGAITVSADAALSGVDRLELETGADVTATAGGLVVSGLGIVSGGDVAFTDTSTDVDTLTIDATGNNITFFDSTALSAALTASSVNVSANNGLTLTGGLSANGNVILNADADNNGSGVFTLAPGVNVSTNNNALTVTANDVVLQAGSALNAGTDTASFFVSNGGQINLGGTGANMNLSNAELSTITADRLVFGNGTTGAIALLDALTHNASAVTLHSGGAITGTAGGLSADVLDVIAGGTVNLTHASNDIDDLYVSAAGQSVSFRDVDDVNLAGVTANSFALIAGGAVTDSAATLVNNLSVTASNAVILDNASNDVSVLTVNAGANAVTYVDVDGYDIAGLTGGVVTLNASGALTDSGTITAAALNVTATGDVTLNTVTNDVDNLFVSAAGRTVTFRDADGLNLAGVTADGFILTAGGAVTDSAATIARTFSITGTGDITLDEAGNDADSLSVSAAGRAVSFMDTDGIDLSGITADSFILNAGGAVTDSAAAVVNSLSVTASGPIALDIATNNAAALSLNAGANTVSYRDTNGFDISGLTGATISLTANGAVTGSGVIAAQNLNIVNAADITLNNPANDIDNLFVSASGRSVSFTDADDINLSGIAANSFALTAGGNVTDDAETIVNTLSVAGTGDVILDEAANNVSSLNISAGSNAVSYVDANGFDIAGLIGGTVTLSAAGALTDSGAITAQDLNISNTGDITLNSVTNDVDNLYISAAGRAVVFADADDINLAGITANGFTLTAGGAVTDSAATIVNALSVTGAGGIVLDEAANDTSVLTINAGSNTVHYVDTNGFDIAGLTGGAVTLEAFGALTDSGMITAQDLNITNTGDVTLSTASNDVDNLFISAAGRAVTFRDADGVNLAGITAGSFILTAGGAVSDSAATATDTLSVTASGAVILDDAANDINTLTINAGSNAVYYVDANGYDIAGLTGGAVTLEGSGDLTDSGAIKAQDLNITNTGDVTLNTASNDVDNLSVSAAGHAVTFRDADGINLAGITAGSFTLTTGGAITDSAGSVITGNTVLAAGAGNDIILDHAGNDLSVLNIVSARNVTVSDSNNLSIGNSSISGTLNAQAHNNLTIAGTVQAGGHVDLVAMPANGGVFTINNGAALNAPGRNVTVTAHDAAINGVLNVGGGTLTLRSGAGAVWALGTATGQFSLSGAELESITAGTMTLGGVDSGNILVQNISSTQSAGIGAVVLQGYGNNSIIQFGPGGASFRSLIAQADAEIRVLGSLSTTTGNMVLDGDYDDFFDPGYANNVVYGAGVSVTSKGSLNAGGSTGNGVMQGNLVMMANAGNLTLDALDGAHDLTLTVNGGGDVIITGAIGGLIPVSNAVIKGDVITGEIHASSLGISANEAYLSGTVDGYTGEEAADHVVLNKKIPGPYLMNGFIIEGYVPPPPSQEENLPDRGGGASDPVSIQAQWIAQVPHPLENRGNTIGDLVRQDIMRRPYIVNILERADAFLTFSRDFFRIFFLGNAHSHGIITVASNGSVNEDDDKDQ